MRIISFLIFLYLSLNAAFGQNYPDSLNLALEEIHKKSKIPGFSISIINNDKVVYQNGFGYADKENDRSYELTSVQNIGSISKTFIGVALMKLVDQGKLSLDTDINEILPFEIINPKQNETKITIKHLATHTSSLVETNAYNKICYVLEEDPTPFLNNLDKAERRQIKAVRNNKKSTLENFLREYFIKGGQYYKKKNFSKHLPGTNYEYSNIASALAAYIVELVAKKDFRSFVNDEIFQPLAMTNSTYHFDEVDKSEMCVNYSYNGGALPKYSLLTYPDGGVYTNNQNLTQYFVEMIKGYNNNSNFLNEESFKQMYAPHFQDEEHKSGIFWAYNKSGSIGHNGADPGIFTYMYYTDQNIGLVFMCNTLSFKNKEMTNTVRQILRKAHSIGLKLK